MFLLKFIDLFTLVIFLLISLSETSPSSNSESLELLSNDMRPQKPQFQQVPISEETSAENRIHKRNHHHNHNRNSQQVPTGSENNAILKARSSSSSSSSSSNANTNNNNNFEEQPCLSCASSQQTQQLESTLPERTLRAMRLEMIKQQILKKLRVTEPPRVEDMPKDQKLLPAPVLYGDTLERREFSERNRGDRDVEDFYGKPEQVIVFPEEVMPGCLTFLYRTDPSACFLFNFPKKIQPDSISSAELWVFKLPHHSSRRNQTFWVAEVTPDLESEEDYDSVRRSEIIGIRTNLRQRSGWLSLNISEAAKTWLSGHHGQQHNHTLQMGCQKCGFVVRESPIALGGEERPFIVFNIAGVAPKKRTRRHVDCSPGVSECCRERFVVDFREIGLDHWIIAPMSYDAFYCKGSCVSLNGLSHSKTGRTSIVQKYLQYHGVNNRTQELVPCCTASKMSSVRLFFRDVDTNTTIRDETLPNMVIESCGCL